jgi:tetratricopeptide (TPR) repeat protein
MSRIDQLQKLLELEPNDPFCLYGLAQEYVKTDELEKAIAYFDKTLEADGNYVYAYYHRGKALLRLGRRDDALATFRRGHEVARAVGDEKGLAELRDAIAELS